MALVNDRVFAFSLLCRWHYFIWRDRKRKSILPLSVFTVTGWVMAIT